MIPIKAIGLIVTAAGAGLSFVSSWVEDQKTKEMVAEEVERQLAERENEEETNDEE